MGVFVSLMRNAINTLTSAASILRALSAEFDRALQRAAQSPGLPNPEPTQPYWLQDPPFPELVDISSSKLIETADVAIIGSGIAGAAVARSLLHERRRRNSGTGEKIIVFDARQLCSGATARNGGHIKPAMYDCFSRLSKLLPKDRAAALTRFQSRHVDCLIELCKSEGIEAAEARKVETVDVFLDSQAFYKASEYVAELKKRLPDVEIAVWNGDQARKVRMFDPCLLNNIRKLTQTEVWYQRHHRWCLIISSRCNLGIPVYYVYLERPASSVLWKSIYRNKHPCGVNSSVRRRTRRLPLRCRNHTRNHIRPPHCPRHQCLRKSSRPRPTQQDCRRTITHVHPATGTRVSTCRW